MTKYEFTFVFPCLNEAETIGQCLKIVKNIEKANQIRIEIVVADNGSTDGSQDICSELGAKVVNVRERGYGAALDAGIRASSCEKILIADSDLSYDISQCLEFIKALDDPKIDLVMGNRFAGKIHKDAMPWHHKYFGNPVLSFIGRFLFHIDIGDFHCGIRAFRKSSYLMVNPKTKGMEFATEMIVGFARNKLKIIEIPTSLFKDGRSRKPHLRSFRDGWRHLKYMILFSPQLIFLWPGIFLASSGGFVIFSQLISNLRIVTFEVSKTQLASSAFILLIGISLFSIGSINIAVAKVKGLGDFKFSTINYSRFREIFAITVPVLLMVLGCFGFFRHEILGNNNFLALPSYFSYIEFSIGVQLLSTAIAIRSILSKFW